MRKLDPNCQHGDAGSWKVSRVARFLWLVAVAGCTSNDSPHGAPVPPDPADGGADAPGATDGASADRASDAPGEASKDSPSGGDAWWDPARTTWTALPWAADCEAEVASEPERTAPALTWVPCAGGPPGCSILEPPAPPDDIVRFGTSVAHGGGYWFGMVMVVSGAQQKRAVLYDPDGKARLVVRLPWDKCGSAQMLPGGTTTCLEILTPDFQGTRYGCAAPDRVASLSSATATLPVVPQASSFTGEIVSMWIVGGQDAVFDLSSGKLHPLIFESDYFDRPAAWGANLLAAVERRADGTRVGAIWKRPNDVVFLVSRAPEHVINLNTDGESLVWVQARADVSPEQTQSGGSIWRSPFVTSAAELAPAKVCDIGDVPSWVVSRAGAGHYALQASASHLDVIRLSDGGRRLALPPAGWDIAGPDFVDAEHLFYTARSKRTAATSGFVRQAHRALESEDR